MRAPNQVVSLMVERRIQEEPVVIDLEVLVLLADPALAERQELLALGERTHGDGPFLESNWHRRGTSMPASGLRETGWNAGRPLLRNSRFVSREAAWPLGQRSARGSDHGGEIVA